MTKTALLTAGLLLCASGAWGSECYSVRDPSARQACLAEERGEPADCLGVRDPDQRTLCRQRASREQRFKELERGR